MKNRTHSVHVIHIVSIRGRLCRRLAHCGRVGALGGRRFRRLGRRLVACVTVRHQAMLLHLAIAARLIDATGVRALECERLVHRLIMDRSRLFARIQAAACDALEFNLNIRRQRLLKK